MRSLRIVLIVACLVGDMATPLCPGAFRFDLAESIEGVGSRPGCARQPHVNAVSPPGHEDRHAAPPRSPRQTGKDLVARLPIWAALPRAALGSIQFDRRSPRSAEDG
jgi:hypothetical protein